MPTAETTVIDHVSLVASNDARSRGFYEAAVGAGGIDHGPRPQYHADCQGAFVTDPDGHDIEAVSHQPEP